MNEKEARIINRMQERYLKQTRRTGMNMKRRRKTKALFAVGFFVVAAVVWGLGRLIEFVFLLIVDGLKFIF